MTPDERAPGPPLARGDGCAGPRAGARFPSRALSGRGGGGARVRSWVGGPRSPGGGPCRASGAHRDAGRGPAAGGHRCPRRARAGRPLRERAGLAGHAGPSRPVRVLGRGCGGRGAVARRAPARPGVAVGAVASPLWRWRGARDRRDPQESRERRWGRASPPGYRGRALRARGPSRRTPAWRPARSAGCGAAAGGDGGGGRVGTGRGRASPRHGAGRGRAHRPRRAPGLPRQRPGSPAGRLGAERGAAGGARAPAAGAGRPRRPGQAARAPAPGGRIRAAGRRRSRPPARGRHGRGGNRGHGRLAARVGRLRPAARRRGHARRQPAGRRAIRDGSSRSPRSRGSSCWHRRSGAGWRRCWRRCGPDPLAAGRADASGWRHRGRRWTAPP